MKIEITSWMTVLLGAATVAGYADTVDETQFTRKMLVTFGGCEVGVAESALEHFPALIKFDPATMTGFEYADFSSPEDGADLRFADAEGNELNYEIDTWDMGGTSLVWVQVPALRTNTVITAYWGGADTVAPAYASDGSTWSNGYIAVWHFSGDDAAARTNSTKYANTLSTKVGNTITLGAGASGGGGIGNVAAFAGGASYLSAPDNAIMSNTAKLTIEMLVCDAVESNTGIYTLLSKRQSSSTGRAYAFFKQDGEMKVDIGGSNNSNTRTPYALVPTKDVWYHLAAVFDGTTEALQSRLFYYSDADPVAVAQAGGIATGMSTGIPNVTSPLYIGLLDSDTATARTWNGYMDEVRLSNVARSPAWIAASHKTMMEPDAFAAYDDVLEIDAAAPVVISVEPLISGATVTLRGMLQSEGDAPATVTVYFGTTDGKTNPQTWGVPPLAATVEPDGTVTNVLTFGTDLAYDTTYYYRHYADNGVADSWAVLTISFTTPGAAALGEPSAAGTPVSFDASVDLLDIGAAPATVSCWIGETPEQLTVVTNWPNLATPQTLTHTHAGLIPGSTWHYAFSAVNTMPGSGAVKTVWTATNSITLLGDMTWTDEGATTDWADAANWDYGVPTEHIGAHFLAPAERVTAGAPELFATNLVFKFNGDLNMALDSATLTAPGGMNVGAETTVNLTLESGTIDLVAGELMIGSRGSDNTVTIAPGADMRAGTIIIGVAGNVGNAADAANRNKLIVHGTLSASGLTTISRRPRDIGAQNNELQVLEGGCFIATGITLGRSTAGSGDNILSRLIVDGGTVTNTGSLIVSDQFGANHGVILRNGATLRNIGALTLSQRAKTCYMHVLGGSVAEFTGAVKINDFGDSAGNSASLVVSNAQFSATQITVGNRAVGTSNTIRLFEDAGESAEIRLSGKLDLSLYSRHNVLHIDGGLFSASAINTGVTAASASNSVVSVTGPAARVRVGSMSLKYHTTLAFAIPDNGFNEAPIVATGNIVFDDTTKVDISADAFTGRAVLCEAASITELSEERFTVNVNPGKRYKLFQSATRLEVLVSDSATLLILR